MCATCREKERLEAKYREQLDASTSRASDLDTENRQLRGLKYELDTKVLQCHLSAILSYLPFCMLKSSVHTLACGLGATCNSLLTDYAASQLHVTRR